MKIVDNHEITIAVSTHATNHHEVTLVQLTFNFYMIEAMPEKLIGDRAYDSDTLDKELAQDGIDMVAPHRKTVAKRALRMDARFVDTLADGSSNASLHKFNGGEESLLDGSIIWTTS